MAVKRLADLRSACDALGNMRVAIDVVEQLRVAGIPPGLGEGPMRQRILQKVLLDRVVLRHRYQGLPHVGMDLGAQRIEKREQSADDLGGKFLLLDLLLCSVEDQRQLRASG